MRDKKIIMLAGQGQASNIVFNALNEEFGVQLVIMEDREPMKIFLKRRVRRLGIVTVAGQVLFQMIIAKLLNATSKKRQEKILTDAMLSDHEIPAEKIKRVRSVNAAESIDLIRSINPDLIIVNGTRIISKKVLGHCSCKLINTHAGITPMYRGVHGMYWALVNKDIEHSGVTVHFVDEGIDTGNIIEQKAVLPVPGDNFMTYPLLQLAAGVSLLKKAVRHYFEDTIQIKNPPGKSALYYHPTIWQYLYHRIKGKVK
jgi:folate-dependent phosphoribosylglycinamide formyltransferase PurN